MIVVNNYCKQIEVSLFQIKFRTDTSSILSRCTDVTLWSFLETIVQIHMDIEVYVMASINFRLKALKLRNHIKLLLEVIVQNVSCRIF
jgi:hypothetical protein